MTIFAGVPNEFVPNTLADADEVNENNDFIKSWINGNNIDCADNIRPLGISTGCIEDGAVTEAKLATGLLDGIRTTAQARVIRATLLTVGNQSLTTVPFDNTGYESVEMHNDTVNNTRVVIPEDGVYTIKAQVKWEASAALDGKLTYAELQENGSGLMGRMTSTGSALSENVSVQVVNEKRFTAGEYIQLKVFQASGANLDTVAGAVWMTVRKVSDA